MIKKIFWSALIATILYFILIIVFLGNYILDYGIFSSTYQVLTEYFGWWVFFFVLILSIQAIQVGIKRGQESLNKSKNQKTSLLNKITVNFLFVLFLIIAGLPCVLFISYNLLLFHPIFSSILIPICFYLVIFSCTIFIGMKKFKVNSWVGSIFSVISFLCFIIFTLSGIFGFFGRIYFMGECENKKIYVIDGFYTLYYDDIYQADGNLILIGKIYSENNLKVFDSIIYGQDENGMRLVETKENNVPNQISSCPQMIEQIKLINIDY